jgi:clan AA aspartic protease (TIGR02281 family)
VALEVADEYVRRAPTIGNPRYLRAVALQGLGDYNRAIADYAESIELFSNDRTRIGSHVFTRMAESYAKLGRFCEATTPILTWIAIDPVRRDNDRTRKIVADYEQQGNCVLSKTKFKERFAQRSGSSVVTVPVTINGARGVFIIDTGASYVSIKKTFADKAKIAYADSNRITLHTANGTSQGRLTKADTVKLGQLDARQVPVVVQDNDNKGYGPGVDGLLGMSFLSRFDVQMKNGFIEVATRARK